MMHDEAIPYALGLAAAIVGLVATIAKMVWDNLKKRTVNRGLVRQEDAQEYIDQRYKDLFSLLDDQLKQLRAEAVGLTKKAWESEQKHEASARMHADCEERCAALERRLAILEAQKGQG